MVEGREPLRLVRGALAATLATAAALAGHVLGGADVPGWLGIALPWWLSVTLCTALAGARFSLPRLGAAIAGSQALFHLLFIVGTPGDSSVTFAEAPGMHIHLGFGAGTATTAQSAASTAAHVAHSAHLTGPMLLAHLLAAAATVAVIHRGESVLLRAIGLAVALAAALGLVLAPPRVPALHLPSSRRPSPQVAHLPRRRRALLRPLVRRGPPLIVGS